jgi:glutamate racemase
VPAIKPAAAAGQPVAIWATVATTGSAYQRGLIEQFAAGVPVAEVACPGLADAIHAGDDAGIDAAVAAAAERTPAGTRAVVLGCTEYELAADRIQAAVPGAVPFGSAAAVAAQALRRLVATPAGPAGQSGQSGQYGQARLGQDGHEVAGQGAQARAAHDGQELDGVGRSAAGDAAGTSRGEVDVLLSGRPGQLPPAALRYPEGRLLAGVRAGPAPGRDSEGPAARRAVARQA